MVEWNLRDQLLGLDQKIDLRWGSRAWIQRPSLRNAHPISLLTHKHTKAQTSKQPRTHPHTHTHTHHAHTHAHTHMGVWFFKGAPFVDLTGSQKENLLWGGHPIWGLIKRSVMHGMTIGCTQPRNQDDMSQPPGNSFPWWLNRRPQPCNWVCLNMGACPEWLVFLYGFPLNPTKRWVTPKL